MFTALHALAQSATLMIVVNAEGDDLRVSITPTQAGDKTKAHKLTPLSLVASAAELDEGFADAILSWQSPKLSLLEQVAAANAATGAGGESASASSKAAPKDVAPKRSGPGRPKKNEAAAQGGDAAAGATTGAADIAGQQDSTPAATQVAPGAAEQDGAVPPASANDAEEPEEITLAPAGNPAITAAVDTVTLDLF